MKPSKETLRVYYKMFGEFPCWKKCTCQYNVDGLCSDMANKPNPIDRECSRVGYLLNSLKGEKEE